MGWDKPVHMSSSGIFQGPCGLGGGGGGAREGMRKCSVML